MFLRVPKLSLRIPKELQKCSFITDPKLFLRALKVFLRIPKVFLKRVSTVFLRVRF